MAPRCSASVDSACEPDDDLSLRAGDPGHRLRPAGESKLVAMTTAGRTLWISGAPSTEIWPQLTVAANGSRLAWATLDATHSINSYSPMDADDIREQSVTVFNAADGDIALVSPLSPIFDAGGNVAISPSGRRVALINGRWDPGLRPACTPAIARRPLPPLTAENLRFPVPRVFHTLLSASLFPWSLGPWSLLPPSPCYPPTLGSMFPTCPFPRPRSFGTLSGGGFLCRRQSSTTSPRRFPTAAASALRTKMHSAIPSSMAFT